MDRLLIPSDKAKKENERSVIPSYGDRKQRENRGNQHIIKEITYIIR